MIPKLPFAAGRVARKEKQTKHQCDNSLPQIAEINHICGFSELLSPTFTITIQKWPPGAPPGAFGGGDPPENGPKTRQELQKTGSRAAKGAPRAAQGRFLSGLGETNLAPKSLPETSTRPCGTLRCSILQPPGCGTPRSSILHPPEDDFGRRGRFIRRFAGGTFERLLALTNLFSYHPRGLPKGSARRTKLTPGASPEYGQKTIKPKSNKLLEHA